MNKEYGAKRMTELTLEQLPMHELKSRCKQAGLKFKNTSKKVDLIDILTTGESNIEVKKEPKRAPKLQEQKTEKSVPLLPKEFEMNIKVRFPTLAYSIDEKSNCINFFAKIPGDTSIMESCVNIDSNERVIYKVAQEAAQTRGGKPIIYSQNNVQAARLDSENRELAIKRMEMEAEIKNAVTQG
jgi:hypothetical protein